MTQKEELERIIEHGRNHMKNIDSLIANLQRDIECHKIHRLDFENLVSKSIEELNEIESQTDIPEPGR